MVFLFLTRKEKHPNAWFLYLGGFYIHQYKTSQIFDFYIDFSLKLYKRNGYAEFEFWPSIKLDAESERELGFDPNAELDWRNQASAHTDCFLKYKVYGTHTKRAQ